jgi:hypothetical protein
LTTIYKNYILYLSYYFDADVVKIKKVSFLLNIPDSLKQRLTDFADGEQKKLTQVVLDAIREYLDRRGV